VKNYFPWKIIFHRKSFSKKIIFTPTKHTRRKSLIAYTGKRTAPLPAGKKTKKKGEKIG